MKKIFYLLLLVVFGFNISWAQSYRKSMDSKMDSIISILNRVEKAKTDSMRLVLGKKSADYLQEILMHPRSWNIDYSPLKKKLSILESKDHSVRIFTWAVPLSEGYRYYGFIQRYDKKHNMTFFYRLYDRSDDMKNPEKQYLDQDNWYGCVYYDLITKKYKHRTIYTVLGADPDGDLINRKIIDVITFRGNGSPRFGYDFHNEYGQPVKRFIFEYNNQASMMLRWEDRLKMIVFDHLSPSEPRYKGLHQFYGPDFSYDGLKFEKGKWIYLIDIDLRAPKK